MAEYFDVVIVGGGICGITAAYYIQNDCPHKTYVLLEGRGDIGGTWDLFKYPGVRSDSEMYTFGFPFRPWSEKAKIAPGNEILQYMKDTVNETGIIDHVRANQEVVKADYSSELAQWAIETANGKKFTCRYFFVCTGYFKYDEPNQPVWPGMENFGGKIVHPQQWSDDIDYTDKKVIIVGSGATSVTMVPVMAEKAKLVTMLQRSPGYFFTVARNGDLFDKFVSSFLSQNMAWTLSRWKHIAIQFSFYKFAKQFPSLTRKFIMNAARRQLPANFNVDVHLNPRYNPWDERLCACPSGDFFRSIREKKADIVTDTIAEFTKTGVKLASDGKELAADIVVTATGFQMQDNFPVNKIKVTVDGKPYDAPKTTNYKDFMLSDIPNFFFILGYLQESLTLKAEIMARYVTRVINHMERSGYNQCCPRNPTTHSGEFLSFTSGYLKRVESRLPRPCTSPVWSLFGTYIPDKFALAWRNVEDGGLFFSGKAKAKL